jgi:peptidoglycan/LPS O-acetylase OafA/YrhL
MLACLPFAYMWMSPSQLKDFAQSLVAVVFLGSNILFWRESGYFEADAELKPLLHTWSLAVEDTGLGRAYYRQRIKSDRKIAAAGLIVVP